jgi:hypothetical protein
MMQRAIGTTTTLVIATREHRSGKCSFVIKNFYPSDKVLSLCSLMYCLTVYSYFMLLMALLCFHLPLVAVKDFDLRKW